MNGLPISRTGAYYFVVELQQDGHEEWVPKARLPLTVTLEVAAPTVSGA